MRKLLQTLPPSCEVFNCFDVPGVTASCDENVKSGAHFCPPFHTANFASISRDDLAAGHSDFEANRDTRMLDFSSLIVNSVSKMSC